MLKNFLLNLLLSMVWVALTGQLNYVNFIFGFVLGFFILWLIHRSANAKKDYFFRVPKIIAFIGSFFFEMLKANFEVAVEILRMKRTIQPGIVKFETLCKTDFELTMFTNIISLTPGTLVLEISSDKKFIFIHGMNLKNKERFKANLQQKIEKKLLEIIR